MSLSVPAFHCHFLIVCLLCPVLKPAVYEEVQQTPSTKLKIKDQEIDAVRYILFCIISWYNKDIFERAIIIITLIHEDPVYDHLCLYCVDPVLLTTVMALP